MLEEIAGSAFPASFSDTDALLAGTGRRAPTGGEQVTPGGAAARLPLVLGRPPAARPGPAGEARPEGSAPRSPARDAQARKHSPDAQARKH
ncbi:hypothetical protein ACFF45_06635, partial [Streptomyces cinereospinus]